VNFNAAVAPAIGGLELEVTNTQWTGEFDDVRVECGFAAARAFYCAAREMTSVC
jgi:hypothetical protein